VPAACQAELDLFREVLGTQVTRIRHIPAGDRCCEYRIAPDPPT
jgi:predicted ArsR family transcriptional regulator